MMNEMVAIEINGNWLKSSYSVYVVEIKHKEELPFYYIGQTGDAKYDTARPPFYRITGHLGYTKSTQNQIYKRILEKKRWIGKDSREKMENYFVACKLNIYSFPIEEFSYRNDHTQHLELRRKTLIVETFLIEVFSKCFPKQLLNKSFVSFKRQPDTNLKKIINMILNKLKKVLLESEKLQPQMNMYMEKNDSFYNNLRFRER